jgi:hypothetical protein
MAKARGVPGMEAHEALHMLCVRCLEQGQGYRVHSHAIVIPGAAQHAVVRCRPGTQVPRHAKS